MNKKILILMIWITFFISGCGSINRSLAEYTGSKEVIVDGVHYLQFPSGVTVKYDREGKIVHD